MQRTLMHAKIHRATVTQADLHYVGSLTIDSDLMAAAGIVENEKVQVVDATNGARLETYVIAGEPGSGGDRRQGAAHTLCTPEIWLSSSRTPRSRSLRSMSTGHAWCT